MTDNLTAAADAGLDLADLFGIYDDVDWQAQALCAQTDPEAFFPEKGGSTREAKQVCAACPVRTECLTYALEHQERFGVWGGLSERERRRLKRPHSSGRVAGTGNGGDYFCGQNGCPYRGATQHALNKHRTRHHTQAAA